MLFDFDGTLSEIVDHPSKAIMIRGWRDRLKKLSKRKHVIIGIVTGRALTDIRSRVGIPGILYAASHGFEIVRGRKRLLSVGKEHRRPLRRLALDLAKALGTIANTQVEFKGTAVAVHYRRTKPNQHALVKRTVRRLAQPLLAEHGWKLTGGKMVLEIRPAAQWNKGKAVEWIWEKLAPQFLPCYIGDDVTDEDAFRALGARGITIRIGENKNSYANYFVRHADELIPLLEEIS